MLQTAFDTYAVQYDKEFTQSPIGKLQRKRVFHFFNRLLTTKKKILEINCGTGYDAIQLAQQGHEVSALDISQGMIEVARAKTKNGTNPLFICEDLRHVKKLQLPKTDIIFSNFGGLNCVSEQDLKNVVVDFHSQLHSNGSICAVVMGSNCKWEDIYFKYIKHPSYQRRKKSEGVSATINGNTFTTWYYSPYQLKTIFESHFSCELIKPIGLFIPPSYLNYYFETKSWALKLLAGLETVFGGISSLSNYADHYLIILKRKEL